MDANSQFLYATDHATYAKRHYLSQFLREKTDSIVQYGILKGYEIGPSRWAEAAVGTYILGTYEVHICALLEQLASPDRLLIDIGAADGLYGIGLVAVGAFESSLCFEADAISRESLSQKAEALSLSDKIAVHGSAEPETISAILAQSDTELAGAVVLCDIEGAEFALFTPELLGLFAECHVIIEIHDFLLPADAQAEAPLANLIQRAEVFFHVHIVKDGLRYLRDIPLLESWSDADVWTMCMEGRKQVMTWLYLVPKREKPIRGNQIDKIILDYQKSMFD